MARARARVRVRVRVTARARATVRARARVRVRARVSVARRDRPARCGEHVGLHAVDVGGERGHLRLGRVHEQVVVAAVHLGDREALGRRAAHLVRARARARARVRARVRVRVRVRRPSSAASTTCASA